MCRVNASVSNILPVGSHRELGFECAQMLNQIPAGVRPHPVTQLGNPERAPARRQQAGKMSAQSQRPGCRAALPFRNAAVSECRTEMVVKNRAAKSPDRKSVV